MNFYFRNNFCQKMLSSLSKRGSSAYIFREFWSKKPILYNKKEFGDFQKLFLSLILQKVHVKY